MPVSLDYRYETEWLQLPSDLVMGEITAVSVDERDHVWVLHRPRTAKAETGKKAAPPVAEFDSKGRYLHGFGGPNEAYEWPTTEHSLAVSGGSVWVGGNNLDNEHGDDMLLVFDLKGRFIRQIGRRGAAKGNLDVQNFHAPADIFIDRHNREAYVADGYGNQRLIVLDSASGRFKRMWGAFGKAPPAQRPVLTAEQAAVAAVQGAETFRGLHGVERARDGTVYVSDRGNQRIQAFTTAGEYIGQMVVNRGLASAATVSGMTFSRDPDQKYIFVADWGNGMIVILDRRRLTIVGSLGRPGQRPGEFKGPHLIDTDSNGVIYVAEVQGRRLQRIIPPRGNGLRKKKL